MTNEQIAAISPLMGWKDIASYFKVTKNTVKAWHKKRPMPIKYTPGKLPVAYPDDLRAWLGTNKQKQDS